MGFDIVQNVETKGLIPTSSCLSAKVSHPCVELIVLKVLPGDKGFQAMGYIKAMLVEQTW